jgi:HD superfamily phosphohydrolase YqeK
VTTDSIIEKLTKRGARVLSSQRFAHIQRVAVTAEALAQRFAIPRDIVCIAALTHDMHREKSSEKLLAAVERWQIPIAPRERQQPILLHGAVSAAWLIRKYGDDLPCQETLYTAIRHHTLGSPELVHDTTGVGLALFVADSCEDGRSWPRKKQRQHILQQESLADMSRLIIEMQRQRWGKVEEPTAHMYAQLIGQKGAPAIP